MQARAVALLRADQRSVCLRFKLSNPGTNLLALPTAAWPKLANIQDFEISRSTESECTPGSGTSVLVDADANTNDIDAVLQEIKSLQHMDTSVHTGVTLKNLCIPGYFHGGSGFDTHFSHFKKLDLSGNLITGTLDLGDVNDWDNLEELALASNMLEGEIPAILDELPRLKKLDLSGNSFTGAILNDWAAGCVLEELDLTNNNLNGTWPQNLAQCISVHVLKLSSNALSGEIPANFFADMGLRVLHLDDQLTKGGGLSGPLPPSIFEMRRPYGTLEELKVNDNMFTGSLPAIQTARAGDCSERYCLGVVPGTLELDPSLQCYNSFMECSTVNCLGNGYTPVQECRLYYVTPIPSADGLSEVPYLSVTGPSVYDNPVQKLAILQLHNNQLDGTLPDLSPYCVSRASGSLDEFTFHKNLFTGRLPQSYAFCTSVSTLQLEHLPNLEGPLPDIEPSYQTCAACAARQSNNDQCPSGTIEQTFEQDTPYPSTDGTLGNWPGVDSNGAPLRPDGAAKGSPCCRWFKCFSGEYIYSSVMGTMIPTWTADLECTAGQQPENNICSEHPSVNAPSAPVGATHGDVVQGTMTTCAVLMDEYDYTFMPPHYSSSPWSFCDQEHIGLAYTAAEISGGSSLDTVIIDGSFMGSMTGDLPKFDNNAQLHTIDVKNANWLQMLPLLQNEVVPAGAAASCSLGSNDPDCGWMPVYASLTTLSVVDSITPNTPDGFTYAVHPTLHVGDLHGHESMRTVVLSGNNLKGDLPNVDDPDTDTIDDLRTFDVSSNQFGGADCIDSSIGGADVDCVPATFQELYKLSDFDLTDNAMAGPVPQVFFKLPHLKTLTLSYNAYTGFTTACTTAAECSCEDLATSTVLSMYHRRDIDLITNAQSFVPPVGGSLSSSDYAIDIRYNQLTALPVHQLRMFRTIDAGNNAITADGLKGAYSSTSDVGVFSELADAGCDAYTYPSLQKVDLSGNPFGDCAATSNPVACRNDLETMMEALRAVTEMRTLDLSDGSFSHKIEFPADWVFGTMWPDIVTLKLGGIFSGVMPFGSLGLPSGPTSMTTLHLMDGELRSPIMLGPVDPEAIQSQLGAKFAPYEIAYENRRVEIIPAASSDGFAFTQVSFTVLKGASWASASGPSPGVTAVTAARLATDLGVTKIQELDPQARVCDDGQCGVCRIAARGLDYCSYLGRPDSSDSFDYEIRAAQNSGLELDNTRIEQNQLDTAGTTAALLKAQVEALRDADDVQYGKMSVLYDYTVRHLGCPGRGCATGCSPSTVENANGQDCGWEGDYEVTFKLAEVQPRTPPFFTLENIRQLELQNNQLGGELRNVYNHLDYSTISLNGGMPAKYFNVTPMVHADALFFHGNKFSGAIPAILPAHRLATIDPCGLTSLLTGEVSTPPACTPPENYIYQLIFSEPSPSEVGFCTRVPATGLYDCGDNVFDCPMPTVPQAFYVRNTKNDPEHGYCGCEFCEAIDDTGMLLRTCRPDCECPETQACECVSGQRTVLRDEAGQVTGLGEVCEINPYTDCSDRVSKFSYTHPIYDSADCTCASGSDCASSMEMSATNEHATDACRPFCSQCQPGRFASGTNTLTCDLCDPGHYSSQYGQTECDACKRGKYSEGGGAAGGGACQLCGLGFYGVTEGAAACAPAPEGTYVDFEGAYCLDPPDKIPGVWAGTTCDMINATEQPVGPRHCNGGKHASESGSTQCADCEEGRFSLPGGMYRECTPCPAGTMNDPSTSDSSLLCTSCEPGYYQDTAGSQECKQAPIGTFSGQSGLAEARKCEGNTVAPYPGLTVCEECPDKLKPDEDHVNCVPCSVFGTEENCTPDEMTLIGLVGAIGVVVVIFGLSVYKCMSDKKHQEAREHIKSAREDSQ
jgi:hypothetical protein